MKLLGHGHDHFFLGTLPVGLRTQATPCLKDAALAPTLTRPGWDSRLWGRPLGVHKRRHASVSRDLWLPPARHGFLASRVAKGGEVKMPLENLKGELLFSPIPRKRTIASAN